MTEITKTLSAEARKLSPAKRIDLVDDILASLDEPDPNIDRQWQKFSNAVARHFRRRMPAFAQPGRVGIAHAQGS